MRKLRLRKIKTPGLRATKCTLESQDSNPGSQTSDLLLSCTINGVSERQVGKRLFCLCLPFGRGKKFPKILKQRCSNYYSIICFKVQSCCDNFTCSIWQLPAQAKELADLLRPNGLTYNPKCLDRMAAACWQHCNCGASPVTSVPSSFF